MMERPELPSSGAPGAPSPHPQDRSLPAEPPSRDPRIEGYLDQICAELVAVVSQAQQQELRAEWRAHLEARVEAYQELGSAPDEAVVEALRQFGDPQRLGLQWRRAWLRAQEGSPSLLAALPAGARRCFAFASFSSVSLILSTGMGWVPGGEPVGDCAALLAALTMPVSAGLMACALAHLPSRARARYTLRLMAPLAAGSMTMVFAPMPPSWVTLIGIQSTLWMLGTAVGALDGAARDLWQWTRRLRFVE